MENSRVDNQTNFKNINQLLNEMIDWLIDWMISMTYHTIYGYFMPRG